ncbi:MAG: hypothetical protein IMW97_04225 [Firmicutes bacterium]|nr:hypothetical protein [Candidatus Fermentithermobacillaceae bacterium]
MQEKEGSSEGRSGHVSRRPAYLRGTVPRRDVETPLRAKEAVVETGEGAGRVAADKVDEKDEILLSWRVWLLPRNPLKSVLVVSSFVGMLALAYWAVPQVVFTILIAILILNRIGPYIFPMKYELKDATVSFKTYLASNTKRWDELFCYSEYPDGVMLMHDPRTITGRMREGIFLYYDEKLEHKDEILRIVSSKLKPAKEALSGRPKAGEVSSTGGLLSAISRVRRLRQKNPPGESSPD